jgi:hypothetical protein
MDDNATRELDGAMVFRSTKSEAQQRECEERK